MPRDDPDDVLLSLTSAKQPARPIRKSGITLRVSEKGAVSVYGLGRFPVTLYQEQWLKLLSNAADIERFIAANQEQLRVKDSLDEPKRIAPPHTEIAPSLPIYFSKDLSAKQIESTLLALADLYRACGGIGLEIDNVNDSGSPEMPQ